VALVINTNMNALVIENALTNTNNSIASSLQKLSSGLKINSAKDDPAGFAVANSFAAKIAAMNVASQNASEAQSVLQTADGAYSQINNILVQMKSLATEAASGQTNTSDLTGEFQALQGEITAIANSTRYGNIQLLNGGSSDFSTQTAQYASDVSQLQTIAGNGSDPGSTAATNLLTYMALPPSNMSLTTPNAETDYYDLSGYAEGNPTLPQDVSNLLSDMVTQSNTVYQGSVSVSGITFQVGATNNTTNQISISFSGATAACLSVDSGTIGISSLASAQSAMTAIDAALTSVNSFMGDVGATQNQLQYTINNLTTSVQNYTSSQSTIEDVDMASEISNLTKSQILQQSAMAMLAQANAQPQTILKLLNNL